MATRSNPILRPTRCSPRSTPRPARHGVSGASGAPGEPAAHPHVVVWQATQPCRALELRHGGGADHPRLRPPGRPVEPHSEAGRLLPARRRSSQYGRVAVPPGRLGVPRGHRRAHLGRSDVRRLFRLPVHLLVLPSSRRTRMRRGCMVATSRLPESDFAEPGRLPRSCSTRSGPGGRNPWSAHEFSPVKWVGRRWGVALPVRGGPAGASGAGPAGRVRAGSAARAGRPGWWRRACRAGAGGGGRWG
jgi:hypothetical protein